MRLNLVFSTCFICELYCLLTFPLSSIFSLLSPSLQASSTNSLSESDSTKEQRVLQKARVVSEEEAAAQANAFKAFR